MTSCGRNETANEEESNYHVLNVMEDEQPHMSDLTTTFHSNTSTEMNDASLGSFPAFMQRRANNNLTRTSTPMTDQNQ